MGSKVSDSFMSAKNYGRQILALSCDTDVNDLEECTPKYMKGQLGYLLDPLYFFMNTYPEWHSFTDRTIECEHSPAPACSPCKKTTDLTQHPECIVCAAAGYGKASPSSPCQPCSKGTYGSNGLCNACPSGNIY